jgi:hypothetical protein
MTPYVKECGCGGCDERALRDISKKRDSYVTQYIVSGLPLSKKNNITF